MIATMQPHARFETSRPRARSSGRTQLAPDFVAAQVRVLVLVAAAVFLLVLFRQTVGASIMSSVAPSAHVFATGLAWDFLQHFSAALMMWLLIQPVRHVAPAEGVGRVIVIVVAVIVAAALASVARALWITHGPGASNPAGTWRTLPMMFIRFGTLGAMLVAVGEFHRAEVRSVEAMRDAEASRHQLEQQTLEARLKTLEAQIEPHFLFNTLATVRRLYDTDAAAGEAMMERLMRYLEVALPSMRSDRSTLGREAELIAAYLDLQKVRMGRRLEYRIDVAPELALLPVPPMMLLTLVENAIKHGLAPQREGGRVDVSARVEGSQLRLDVADTGRGFGTGTSGGGTGLANIRARLAAMFGHAAELTLTPRYTGGLLAAIRLPVDAITTTAATA